MEFPPRFYRWRPHPWHGLDPGPALPRIAHAYIEITPLDVVKYEIDKATGYLRVDRPQRSTSQSPTLYGFVPRTSCGSRVTLLMEGADRGDEDPLDICVPSERPINRGDVVVNARVVGGIHVLDGGEADDKIVAVLENDSLWGEIEDLEALPPILVERLRHYFGTYYKMIPGTPSRCEVKGGLRARTRVGGDHGGVDGLPGGVRGVNGCASPGMNGPGSAVWWDGRRHGDPLRTGAGLLSTSH